MDKFRLDDRVFVITGGAGLLGRQHARAIAAAGGIPIIGDLDGAAARQAAKDIAGEFDVSAMGARLDVTKTASAQRLCDKVLELFGRLDGLVNNAARNPQVSSKGGGKEFSRLENFPLEQWKQDIDVGLTGALICSQVFGSRMAAAGGGVILNIASDLGLIAPDQRIYRQKGRAADRQPVKPVTYSVVKHGLIGLTRYLSTYWTKEGVRANALCPGGVYTGQPAEFVKKLTQLIPMGRMAAEDEYGEAVVFLLSDGARYMNGSVLSMDGGRTVW